MFHFLHESRSYERYGTLIFIRNIVFAPISEEIVFRGLMVPFLLAEFHDQSTCHQTVILSCPLLFTLAHTHHLYEKIRCLVINRLLLSLD